MKIIYLPVILLFAGGLLLSFDKKPVTQPVIVDAAKFLEIFPKGNIITDAATAKVPWLFNNTAIVMKTVTNMMAKTRISEAGTYHLYVRSQGESGSFRVAVGDTLSPQTFGSGNAGWKKGGSFHLAPGYTDIKLTRISPGSSVDVIVLSTDPALGEEDIKPFQLSPDVKLLKEYKIPLSNAVKFGDVNGDKKTDFMVLSPDFSATVFDNDGEALWSWKAPAEYEKERSEFESPGILWDFNGDGKAEVVHWRFLDNKEWLVMANGTTGEVIKKTEWPVKPLPHFYNNFRLAVGKLSKSGPHSIIVFTDMGGEIRINAYTPDLKLLWSHVELRKKDNLGHYVYPVDLDKDGIDEVLVGSLLLDASGKEIWNRFDLLYDNHDHADSYKFADMDHDGNTEIITANSEVGVIVYKAKTGKILWQNMAEHSQQVQVGEFLEKVPGPQVAIGGRTYGNRQTGEPYLSGQVYWFDNAGNFISKWPGNPLNGNPDFVKGNWKGDGKDELFWYKFRMNAQGKGELYFPDPVFHMFDFMGNGAEQVITLHRGKLTIFGARQASKGNDLKLETSYLKNKVVNHTHY